MGNDEAYQRALRGDLSALAEGSERAGGRSPAWDLVCRGLFGLLAPGLSAAPRPVEVEALRGREPLSPLSAACFHAEMACVLRFDLDGLRRWISVHEQLLRDRADRTAELELRSGELWALLLSGASREAYDEAASLSGESAVAGAAACRVHFTVQRSLAALSLGRVQEGLEAARLGSRMARTEELLGAEYLANVALARARRHAGSSSLAQRILDALALVAPPTWWGWIGWEMVFAGAPHRAASIARAAAGDAAPGNQLGLVLRLLDAAEEGQRAAFHAARSALAEGVRGFRAMEKEARSLAAALSPEVDPDPEDDTTRAWLEGRAHALPPPLAGLCVPEITEMRKDEAAVLVCAAPGGRARRSLRQGLALLGPGVASTPPRQPLAQSRVQTALATLAFAGEAGLTTEELFREVYGFPYAPAQHQAVLRTLLYRARKEVEGRGAIERRGERLRLCPTEILVTPDPRCHAHLEDLVLRTIASLGGRASARDAAAALAVPLRTVQAILQRLVDDGACAVERAGRAVEYVVEDTTFSEPTLHRLRPRRRDEA